MNYNLELYKNMFISLRRGKSCSGSSKAKPIFIVSLLDFIPNCETNAIPFDSKLFVKQYKRNVELYDPNCKTSFGVPFFHLHTEPFYTLVWENQNAVSSIKHTPSAKFLRENLLYAKLDDELWDLLQDRGNREYLKQSIVRRYLED